MTFLIFKIFAYLLFALLLGVAAGWLWRNAAVATAEDALQQQLVEARGRVPPLETRLATQDRKLRAALTRTETLEAELAHHAQRLEQQQQSLAEKDRELKALGNLLAAEPVPLPGAAHADSAAALAELREQLAAQQQRVQELELERELQVRTLQSMSRQLELSRERVPLQAAG